MMQPDFYKVNCIAYSGFCSGKTEGKKYLKTDLRFKTRLFELSFGHLDAAYVRNSYKGFLIKIKFEMKMNGH